MNNWTDPFAFALLLLPLLLPFAFASFLTLFPPLPPVKSYFFLIL